MHFRNLLSCVVVLASAGLVRSSAVDTAIVDKINQIRATVNPTASNMKKVYYDSKLAQIASSWAQQCKFAYDSSRSNNYGGYVGENLFLTTAKTNPTQTATSAIQSWAAERTNYNLDTNSCSPGKQCGSYTQLVWADTTKVGCAVRTCANVQGVPYKNVQIVVCNFAPGGNYRGVKPYKKGPTCGDCGAGSCSLNLCTAMASLNPKEIRTDVGQSVAAPKEELAMQVAGDNWSSESSCRNYCYDYFYQKNYNYPNYLRCEQMCFYGRYAHWTPHSSACTTACYASSGTGNCHAICYP